MVKEVVIQNRKMGQGHPCFIIAEAGVNHNGDVKMAKKLIDAAAHAGADAVKFQTFRADNVVTSDAPKAQYQIRATGRQESQLEMLKKLELPLEAFQELQNYCLQKGILFMSTPFDEDCADFLDEMGMPVFKIPSGELTNAFFVAHVAEKKKPLIVSTGMATLEEVDAAVRIILDANNTKFVLLHCVSSYPADPGDVNLRAMDALRKFFKVPVGFSDHTRGIEVALAAVAMGACVLEKHFTLCRRMSGPDHQVSLEPDELMQLVKGIRTVEMAFGNGLKQPCEAEIDTAKVARRSLVANRDIAKGSRLALEWVAIKRPGTGLAPAILPRLVGLQVKSDIQAGSFLTLEMFE
ncbi:MAG: N-acetylneuraminate synthase [Deltaproteobacteria bacterium]|nr:N-acetylneuraminate synthase [Deltaproteobacteria bacterium]